MKPIEQSVVPGAALAIGSQLMPRIQPRFQRGQSIAEFLIAMLVVVPLVLGVIYVGKYEDIKYTAIEASRYAVFERAFDTLPSPHKSATDLTSETQARFFMDPMQSNQGAVGYKDKPPGQTSGTLNLNWMGAGGEALVAQYPDIHVTVQKDASLLPTTLQTWDFAANLTLANIKDPGIAKGQVTVKLADVAAFPELHNYAPTIDVSTAMLIDGFNAYGNDGNGKPKDPDPNSVRGRSSLLSKANQILPGLNQLYQIGTNAIFQWGWRGLSGTPGPDFFCVAPDVVPLDATRPTGATYDPSQVCN